MKIHWKKLLICIAIPLAVGGLSAFLSRSGMREFDALLKPPLAPPAFLFPVAWTVLYILMGIAVYLVLETQNPRAKTAIVLYGVQLAFNFLWSPIFFNAKTYLIALIWLIILWLLVFVTALLFRRFSRKAALLMIPYLVWLTFAAYLNLGVYILN